MIMPLVFCIFVAVGLMIVWSILSLQITAANDRKERLAAGWGGAARRLGFDYTPPSGPWFFQSTPVLAGARGSTNVTADTFTMPAGKTREIHARVVAKSPRAPHNFTLHLTEEGALDAFSRMFGAHDLEVGQPGDGGAFVVKTRTPALARMVLRPPLTDTLAAHRGTTFHFVEGMVTATVREDITDGEAIESLIRATVALAEAPADVFTRWSVAAEALGGALGESSSWMREGILPPIELDSRGVRLRVETLDSGDHVRISLGDDANGASGGGGGGGARIDAAALATISGSAFAVEDDGAHGPSIRAEANVAVIEHAVEALVNACTGNKPYRG